MECIERNLMKRVWTFYHLKLTQRAALARKERLHLSCPRTIILFITSFNLGSYSNFYYYILLSLLLLLLIYYYYSTKNDEPYASVIS